MKKRNNLLCVMTALLFIIGQAGQVCAQSSDSIRYNIHSEQAKAAQEYAHMDINDVTSEILRDKILEARQTIIYDNSWVADGNEGYVKHADGTIEKLPCFSELFPEWNMPEIKIAN